MWRVRTLDRLLLKTPLNHSATCDLELHTCQRLICDALSDGAFKEVKYKNGEVVGTQFIRHHFHVDSFHPFRFMDDFSIPSARPGSVACLNHHIEHDIQHTFYSDYL